MIAKINNSSKVELVALKWKKLLTKTSINIKITQQKHKAVILKKSFIEK